MFFREYAVNKATRRNYFAARHEIIYRALIFLGIEFIGRDADKKTITKSAGAAKQANVTHMKQVECSICDDRSHNSLIRSRMWMSQNLNKFVTYFIRSGNNKIY